MKTKARVALVLGALSITAAALYGADANPIAGKWATDAMANFEMPEKQSFLKTMAAGAVNGGNTNGGIGNQSGTVAASAPTVSSGRGGRPGGGGPGGIAGNRSGGTPGTPGGTFAANRDRPTANTVVEEEPAMSMEIKVDAKGKVSGTITVGTMVPVHAVKEIKFDKGTVTDKKFEFTTEEKSDKVSTTTRWAGELTDERTITIDRLTKGGQKMDTNSIVFHRAK